MLQMQMKLATAMVAMLSKRFKPDSRFRSKVALCGF
jgi:hypothetical protein